MARQNRRASPLMTFEAIMTIDEILRPSLLKVLNDSPF